MADLGTITTMGSDILKSIFTFLVYGLPLMASGIGVVILYYFLRKRKVFDINCTIYTIADNNTIKGYDKGGIVKNAMGNEEFRLLKRKKSCPVPKRSTWMIQDNGKFSIEFYRHSDDDFEPIKLQQNTKDVSHENEEEEIPTIPKPGLMTRLGAKLNPDYPLDPTIKPYDKKKDFDDIKFIPIKSDSKQFLNMKSKEIVYKNKIAKPLEKYGAMIMWGGLCITFIFMVIWYFKYAGILADKQLSCINPSTVKTMVNEMCNGATQVIKEGVSSPFNA